MKKNNNLSTFNIFKNASLYGDNIVKLDDAILDKYHKYLLEMGKDIIKLCDDENIVYHLTGGSALGAVRHNGFIPWDDDLDIDILGSDFDRFEKLFNQKYSDKYWLHTQNTPGYGMTVNRARMKGTIFRTREDNNNSECGFFIDLLRIENTYDNAVLRKLHGILCMGMGFLLSCRNFYADKDFMYRIIEASPEVKRVFMLKINIGRVISFASVNRWTRMTQRVYGMCKNNNSTYVSVPAGRNHFFGELYKRVDFVETTDMMFEGYKWKIPKEYDTYLKHMYGNYMELPKDKEEHFVMELQFPDEIA